MADTIRAHVEAMGVPTTDLKDTDEYFEVVQSLRVGDPGSPVYEQAKLINPANELGPDDYVQVRRRVGALSDTVVAPPPPPPTIDQEVNADGPLWYAPERMQFDGAQIKIAHAALMGTGSFTLEAWVLRVGQGSVGSRDYGTIFGANSSRRLLVNDTGVVLAQMGGGNTGTTAGYAPMGSRTHIVYVYDATSGSASEKIYVNGVQAVTKAPVGTPSWNAAFWEGAYTDPSANYSLLGYLDHRAVYGKALSAERVAAHYTAGK